MELQILNAIQGIRNPLLDQIMVALTTLGNKGIIWILLAVFLLARKKTRRAGFVVSAALCLDLLFCNVLLKPLVARTRPCDVNTAVQLLISRPADFSFPSGHTAASFAAVSAFWAAGKKKFSLVLLPLALLIAFSRLYLYVHYPTDVLGGAVVGIVCGVLAAAAVSFQKSW